MNALSGAGIDSAVFFRAIVATICKEEKKSNGCSDE